VALLVWGGSTNGNPIKQGIFRAQDHHSNRADYLDSLNLIPSAYRQSGLETYGVLTGLDSDNR